MSQVAEHATTKQDLTAGFDSLDRETRVDKLPLEGRLPDWLQGSLVRTGPGTRMGNLMRRYWVPVLLSREIAQPDGPQVRVQAGRRCRLR